MECAVALEEAVRLTELAIRNFMSIGPEQVISLAAQGLVLIEGANLDDPSAQSNGAGKSTLAEALVWGLYGQTVRGIKTDDVVNRTIGKDCEVRVSWTDAHARACQVTRRRKGTSPTLLFSVDGEDMTLQGEPRITQEVVGRHLGMPFEVFTHTVLFGQGQESRFTELNDAAQKHLLDRVLGVTHLSLAAGHIKSKLAALAGTLGDLRLEMKAAEADMNARKSVHRSLREERECRETQALRDRDKRVSDLVARRGTLKEQIADAGNVTLSVKTIEAKLSACRKGLDSVRDKLTKASRSMGKREAEADAAASASKKAQARLVGAKHATGGRCDACGSKITEKTKARHIKALKREVKHTHQAYESAAYEYDRLEKSLDGMRQDINHYLDAVKRHERELEAFKQANSKRESIARQIETIDEEVARLKAETLPKSSRKPEKQAKKQAQALKEKLASIAKEADKLADEQAYLEFWSLGFGDKGVKSHLLDYVMPLLNQRAQEYSKSLMPGLRVTFDSQTQLKSGEMRDKLDVLVENKHGAGTYEGNSGGEKRKVDIVVARALQSLVADRAKSACNIQWWDEIFESLDEQSSESVMTMLRDEARKCDTVFVVSHLDWLKGHFPKVLRVVKEGGFSRVEWA